MNRNAVIGLAIIIVGVAVMALALTENEQPAHDPNAPWRSDWAAAGELDTPPPEGYCAIADKNDGLEQRIAAIAASRPHLMDKTIGAAFIPCNGATLAAGTRKDQPPLRFGYYAIKSRNSETPPVTSRGKPVSALSDYIADIGRLYGPEKDLAERVEKGARDAPLLGAVNIGLVGSAPYTLFFGALSDGKLAPSGTVMAEVVGASRYGDRILSVMIVAPHDGPETLDELLNAATDAMSRAEAVNRDQ